jgi:hypothetical protein
VPRETAKGDNVNKRTIAALVPAILIVAAPVYAESDQYDCFPICPRPAVEQPRINLCEHRAVREVARIDRQLAPVKEAVDIATNPTGFALKQVDKRIVHIPPWVGYAMDPKGTIKAKVVERVRNEMKKEVGLQHECADEDALDGATSAPVPEKATPADFFGTIQG